MKKVVVISGLPGSGKSTLAESLSQHLRWPVFSVDPIESAILKSGFTRCFETGLAAYVVAQALAAEQLKLGLSVVIDCVNCEQEGRNMWSNLAEEQAAQLYIVECVLDPNQHKERIEKRIRGLHGISEVSWADVEKRRTEYLPWKEKRLALDTAMPVRALLPKVLRYIEEGALE